MTRKELVLSLANMVIQENLKEYRAKCKECDEDETVEDFNLYGTSLETVEAYIGNIANEVLQEVEIHQKWLAAILFSE